MPQSAVRHSDISSGLRRGWGAIGAWLASSLSAAICATLTLSSGADLRADEKPKADDTYTNRIFIANSDGSDMKQLTDLPEYQSQGSPKWSHDGKMIAFNVWRPQLKEGVGQGKIVIVNADGSNPRVISDGLMPTFSPGGGRIVFSRQSPARGVWVMSGEGPEKELVQIDEQGWGSDWSLDGRIVYAADTAGGANLVVFNLVEGTRHFVFEEDKTPYQQIYWSMEWSPDGKQIVFQGRTHDNKPETAIVDARGAKFGYKVRFQGQIYASYAWRQDGTRILFPRACPERGNRTQLYFFDPTGTGPEELLPNQDPERRNLDVAYSPDAKKIVLSAGMRVPPKAK